MRIIRDGIGLAYDDVGEGRPPILLIHGWGTDRHLLGASSAHLAGSHRVVSVDLRGFGESDAPEQPYAISGYADDVAFVVEQLGLAEPIVIGHSMGGMVALDLAARHPRCVSAVVILEGMVVPVEGVLGGLRPMLASVRAEDYRSFMARLMSHLAGPHMPTSDRDRLVAGASACRQHVLVSALEGIIGFDSDEAAARVRCPLLYVGTNTPYADLERFRRLCPQLVTGQLCGCGHYFPLEVPEQLNPVITRFIQTSVPRGR